MSDNFQHISLRLKHLRQARGWSLDKAAAETGVSKAMLGQIERQESSPTIATLWKIATGFKTSFSSFIAELDSELNQPLISRGQTREIHPSDTKIRVMPLFPFDKGLHFEMFVIELLPGCEHHSPPHEPGIIEHVVVVEGGMDILINDTWHSLTKGEAIRFHANQAHGYRNTSATIACFHDLIHYPLSAN